MTGKSRNWVRIEADIVKGREEGNWKKLIELAEHLKSRSPSSECLAHFLIGEGKLESYLETFPPVEQNNNKARSGLSEAKRYLLSTVGEQGKQAGFLLLDVFLLLGKTHYAMGHYEEALDYYNQAELQSLTEKHLPSRSLRIVAESYAIKGMCLEKVPPLSSSKYKQAEWDEQRIQCFELAGDLTLRYLQEQDKQQQHSSTPGSYSPQPPNPAKHIGPILETALQRAPILYMQTGKLQSAVSRYRVMLSAIETAATQSLRLTLTRRLAEVLLRGVTGKVYVNPERDSNIFPKKNKGVAESPWKPRRYIGQHLFVPRTENEEIILLLLISEAMAVRDAVLSQSPEFRDARIHAYKNATAVYDLLTITLVRWGYIDLVYESFERAMKFSFEEPHVWMQKALCLMSMGQYPRALKVLKEVIRLLPTKVLPCLLAARICFEHTNQFAEGLQWSCQALSRETSSPQNLASRCHLYIGIGYSLQAANTTLKHEKQQLIQSALDSFHRAQQTDPNDHLAEYYLGLQYAYNGQLTEAVAHVKLALNLNAEHVPSLQLLVLLLSAHKQTAEALQLLDAVIQEYPDNMNLHYTKAQLELQHLGGEQALHTAGNMLALWKNLYEEQIQADVMEQSDRRSETRSVFQMYSSELSDKDSSSLHAQSLAASRVEHALSEVASSLSSFTPRPGPQKAWLLQVQIWLLLAEIYLSVDNIPEAVECIQEAQNIFPMSHNIMCMRGLLHERKKEFSEAKLCFQNAIAINPTHTKSMQHLGLVYHYLGNQRLAEKTLRDAARIDPSSYQTWYNLGCVLESMNEFDSASDSMATALEVETTNPILPYSSIPLTFE
ncbi:tetratricopeptide repeat protein 7B-like isoform X2 [Schistocerca cancellata]|uniref:tetratricopeptide repeat protein 7B-like isoform X2 n=1 Tax=Schistocerca cancellata TaxID=274614 RepID=UPI002117BFD9|nr:tetratricopeptide repeat protein 7B-like isoform X2 [Schistocerca cancellata]